MRYTETLTALLEKCADPEPKIADLVRLALETLDVDNDEDAAANVLNSILIHSDLAEVICSRLSPMTISELLATHPSQTRWVHDPLTGGLKKAN